MRIRTTWLPLIVLTGCPSWTFGCSSSTVDSSQSGGRTPISGGAPGSAGSSLGGTSALGGNPSSGGQMGGVQGANGGAGSGGANAGGNEAAGAHAGGLAAGGALSGGANGGGQASSSGGRNSGGTNSGGKNSGGTSGAAGAAQGGGAGKLGAGGGASGEFCSPCVSASDCAAGTYCVGGLNPRCGKACANDSDCGSNAPSGSCMIITAGGGLTPGPSPAGIAVRSCQPSDTVCGSGRTRDGLSCKDDWNGYASSFFSTTCIGSCHRHDAAFDTLDKVRTSAESIRFMVDTGAMPQGQTLSDPVRRRLLTWLACGAP